MRLKGESQHRIGIRGDFLCRELLKSRLITQHRYTHFPYTVVPEGVSRRKHKRNPCCESSRFGRLECGCVISHSIAYCTIPSNITIVVIVCDVIVGEPRASFRLAKRVEELPDSRA